MFALLTMTKLGGEPGYIALGAGDFDGQSSGHDFYGVSSQLPPCTVLSRT